MYIPQIKLVAYGCLYRINREEGTKLLEAFYCTLENNGNRLICPYLIFICFQDIALLNINKALYMNLSLIIAFL